MKWRCEILWHGQHGFMTLNSIAVLEMWLYICIRSHQFWFSRDIDWFESCGVDVRCKRRGIELMLWIFSSFSTQNFYLHCQTVHHYYSSCQLELMAFWSWRCVWDVASLRTRKMIRDQGKFDETASHFIWPTCILNPSGWFEVKRWFFPALLTHNYDGPIREVFFSVPECII